VSFKIVICYEDERDRPCFTTQHQTCKTKTTACKTKTKTDFLDALPVSHPTNIAKALKENKFFISPYQK